MSTQTQDPRQSGLIFSGILALVTCFFFDHWTLGQTISLLLNFGVIGLASLQVWTAPKPWIQPMASLLLLVSLLVSGLPFDPGNPFDFFKYPVFQNLISWGAAICAISWSSQKGTRLPDLWNGIFPLVTLIGLHLYFVLLDYNEIPPFDSSRHLMNALSVYKALSGEEGNKIWEALTYYDFYQPISYIAPTPFFWLFGKSYTSALLCQVLFWFPLAWWGGWKMLRFLRIPSGISAIVLTILFSGALSTSLLRHFMQDFPVLTMAIWFQYYWLRSGFLKSASGARKAGLVFGLGVLTKASFLFYLPGILLVTLFLFFQKRLSLKHLSLSHNLVQFAFPVVLTAGFWFFVNHAHYSYSLPSMRNFAALNGLANAEELASWFWYWPRIPRIGSLGLVLLVLLGVLLVFRKKDRLRKLVLFALIAYLLPVAVLSWIPNKDLRTLFPLLAFSLLPVAAFFRSLPSFLRTSLQAVAWMGVLISLSYQTFGWNWKGPDFLKPEVFTVPHLPYSPDAGCPNRSFFTWEAMYKSCFPLETPPKLQFGEADNYHSRMAYKLLLPKSESAIGPIVHEPGEKWFFARSKFWQDHFLWRAFFQDTILVVQNPCRIEQIEGDRELELVWLNEKEEALNASKLSCSGELRSFQIPVFKGASKVRLGWRVHYTHPKGQWVQLVYDLHRRPDFGLFGVPLMLFQEAGTPVETLVLSIPSPSVKPL
jgi:hypothetical protein